MAQEEKQASEEEIAAFIALVEEEAVPGNKHTIAIMVCNAPFGETVGTIFIRYATLSIE